MSLSFSLILFKGMRPKSDVAHRFELRGSLWSELAEKPQQRLGLALLSCPDDPAAEMVYYHC